MAFLPLAASLLPAAWQIGSGIYQNIQGNQVKVQDTRPQEFREMVDMRRQQAGSQLMPGQKTAEARIDQNAANAVAAAQQSGSGPSGVLAALSRIGQQANQSTVALTDQAAGYQMQNKDKLAGALAQDAQWQANDLQAANRERAALKQASATNFFGGLSTLGTAGAYWYGQDLGKTQDTGTIGAETLQNYGPGGIYDPNQRMRLGGGIWENLRVGGMGGYSNPVFR